MKIKEAKLLLDQLDAINPDIDLRIVLPYNAVSNELENISARPVFQNSAWNSNEIVFHLFEEKENNNDDVSSG